MSGKSSDRAYILDLGQPDEQVLMKDKNPIDLVVGLLERSAWRLNSNCFVTHVYTRD